MQNPTTNITASPSLPLEDVIADYQEVNPTPMETEIIEDNVASAQESMNKDIVTLTIKVSQMSSALATGKVPAKNMKQAKEEYNATAAQLASLLDLQAKFSLSPKEPISAPAPILPLSSPGSRTSTVPANLKKFEWRNCVDHELSTTSFMELEECFDDFEDVLTTHALDINVHWCRLVRVCLTPSQRSWFLRFLDCYPDATWYEFKSSFTAEFGLSLPDMKAYAVRKLVKLQMPVNGALAAHNDAFNKYHREIRGALPEDVVSIMYTTSLYCELRIEVDLQLINASPKEKYKMSYVTHVAKEVYEKIRENNNGTSASRHNPANYASSSHRRSTVVPPSSRPEISFVRPGARISKGNNKMCAIHKKGNHSSEECNVLRSLSGSGSSPVGYTPKSCFYCKGPYFHGHLDTCDKYRQKQATNTNTNTRHQQSAATHKLRALKLVDVGNDASSLHVESRRPYAHNNPFLNNNMTSMPTTSMPTTPMPHADTPSPASTYNPPPSSSYTPSAMEDIMTYEPMSD